MEIEITEVPPLKLGERTLLDMHSLLNVMNVLRGELALIGLTLAQDVDLLRASLKICDQETAALSNPVLAREFAGQVAAREAAIRAEIATQVAAHPEKAEEPELAESRANLESVFRILELRARETLTQAGHREQWQEWAIADLRVDFQTVFAAIEKNSKGRYRIIYTLALQQPTDYYIDFDVQSTDGRSVVLPPVFKEVMRDLIANARKYTAPGGTISVSLFETGAELRFVVQDSGLGIPANELKDVFRFGQRGSNVGKVRTMGGGFGLTKAIVVVKELGGRLWIKSDVGVGTRLTIVIPRPAVAAAPVADPVEVQGEGI